MPQPLDIASLTAAYASGTVTPEQIIDGLLDRIAADGEQPIWISLAPRERIARQLADAHRRRDAGATLPLFGIPFAVKDNIDVAGVPTTAACAAFAYTPKRSATVIEKLEAAGAIVVGKTNLDQFATGLVGTRSPYGIPASVFDSDYISGGSSSGSAVAVASGLVSFALGTDTAGSGRVPAAFNNIVGLKPTKGLISTRGVIPACRSQDCVSIFAGTVGEALQILDVAQGFDPEDAYSRPRPGDEGELPQAFRYGVPANNLEFFGDTEAGALYAQAVANMRSFGGTAVKIDFTPFRDAARLLYEGPWVAERLASLKALNFERAEAVHPVVWDIIVQAGRVSAVDAFQAFYKLADLTRAADAEWEKIDVMLLPTTGTTYKISEVRGDPVRLNTNLGYYTNFVNLMDLCGTAVPGGFRPNGLPFGVSLLGRAFDDEKIARLANRLHRALPNPTVGGTDLPLPVDPSPKAAKPARIQVAVVGAHLSGQPLNRQLTDRNARLLRSARTAPGYSLYALAGTVPAKPGLVFDGNGGGLIELEIWEMDFAAFGSFVAEIPPPLGIGTVTLEDGGKVKCFLCEGYALSGAEDITAFAGWRNWLNRAAPSAA